MQTESGPFRRLRLDKRSPTPAYAQIADAMGRLLRSGALPPGYPLPPERLLCDQFGVSRMTLRQAMGILERDGLILSHRGKGTFVAHDRLKKQQQELRGFTEEILARGGKPESRLLSFRQAAAAAAAACEFFAMAQGENLYEIRRIRLSGGVPLTLETVQLCERLCPRLEQFDLEKNSLYRILERSYGLRLGSCVEEISAELPAAEHRRHLDLPRGVAILTIHRKTYTDSGLPLELTKSAYRGDLYSAIVHSVRRQRTGAR
jgi:GntR family transcriptional regulator